MHYRRTHRTAKRSGGCVALSVARRRQAMRTRRRHLSVFAENHEPRCEPVESMNLQSQRQMTRQTQPHASAFSVRTCACVRAYGVEVTEAVLLSEDRHQAVVPAVEPPRCENAAPVVHTNWRNNIHRARRCEVACAPVSAARMNGDGLQRAGHRKGLRLKPLSAHEPLRAWLRWQQEHNPRAFARQAGRRVP